METNQYNNQKSRLADEETRSTTKHQALVSVEAEGWVPSN